VKPTNLLSNGYRDSFPGVRRSGREANHSPPFNAEIKVEWSWSSAPSTSLHGVDRENFTFTVVEEIEETSSRKYLHIVTDVSEELAASIYRIVKEGRNSVFLF
jgi:hypothetical protein